MLIGREIGGTLFPMNGGFTYSDPTILGANKGNIEIHPNTTGIYHTHGSNDPGFDNNNFSPRDLMTSRNAMLNMYLMTPNGKPMQFSSPLSGGLDRCNP